eukprot:6189531-Pyramimonas_sp.AAC.1
MRRWRRRRRRTSVNPRPINDIALDPLSKFPLHRLLHKVRVTEGNAPLEDNCLKIWRCARTPFLGLQHNEPT